MDENERIMEVFAAAGIEGLDFEGGVARFGNNPRLYVKIIRTFVENIGPHIDRLAGLTEDGLESYGITAHGVKGSCYGISANREGDMARELELAAKAGDFEKCAAGNAPFAEAVNALAGKLNAALEEIDCEGAGRKKAAPDKAVLVSMLRASREFDAEKMQEALKELEKYEYENGGDLVKWLSGQVTAFAYDKIEERLVNLL